MSVKWTLAAVGTIAVAVGLYTAYKYLGIGSPAQCFNKVRRKVFLKRGLHKAGTSKENASFQKRIKSQDGSLNSIGEGSEESVHSGIVSGSKEAIQAGSHRSLSGSVEAKKKGSQSGNGSQSGSRTTIQAGSSQSMSGSRTTVQNGSQKSLKTLSSSKTTVKNESMKSVVSDSKETITTECDDDGEYFWEEVEVECGLEDKVCARTMDDDEEEEIEEESVIIQGKCRRFDPNVMAPLRYSREFRDEAMKNWICPQTPPIPPIEPGEYDPMNKKQKRNRSAENGGCKLKQCKWNV